MLYTSHSIFLGAVVVVVTSPPPSPNHWFSHGGSAIGTSGDDDFELLLLLIDGDRLVSLCNLIRDFRDVDLIVVDDGSDSGSDNPVLH